MTMDRFKVGVVLAVATYLMALTSVISLQFKRARVTYDASTRDAVEAAALAWAGPDGRLRGCGSLQAATRCDVVTSGGVEVALLCYPAESVCVRGIGEWP